MKLCIVDIGIRVRVDVLLAAIFSRRAIYVRVTTVHIWSTRLPENSSCGQVYQEKKKGKVYFLVEVSLRGSYHGLVM